MTPMMIHRQVWRVVSRGGVGEVGVAYGVTANLDTLGEECDWIAWNGYEDKGKDGPGGAEAYGDVGEHCMRSARCQAQVQKKDNAFGEEQSKYEQELLSKVGLHIRVSNAQR